MHHAGINEKYIKTSVKEDQNNIELKGNSGLLDVYRNKTNQTKRNKVGMKWTCFIK